MPCESKSFAQLILLDCLCGLRGSACLKSESRRMRASMKGGPSDPELVRAIKCAKALSAQLRTAMSESRG